MAATPRKSTKLSGKQFGALCMGRDHNGTSGSVLLLIDAEPDAAHAGDVRPPHGAVELILLQERMGCVLRTPGGRLLGRTPESDTMKRDFMMLGIVATVEEIYAPLNVQRIRS
jgi:hypothetical protein